MDEEEAIRSAVECINENLDSILVDIIKTKEKLRNARSIPDVMAANKSLMYELLFNFPLESRECPFCWLYAEEDNGDYKFPKEKEDCCDCEYGKTYGNCFEKGSTFDKIDKAMGRFMNALEHYWKEKRSGFNSGAPG